MDKQHAVINYNPATDEHLVKDLGSLNGVSLKYNEEKSEYCCDNCYIIGNTLFQLDVIAGVSLKIVVMFLLRYRKDQ